MEERLKFSSSLYLLLIWVRVLRFVFKNPAEVSKHMVYFQKAPTCEHYIDALVRSMAALSLSPAATPASAKLRLMDMKIQRKTNQP